MKKLLQKKTINCIFLVMLFFTAAGAWGQLWTNPITGSNPGQTSGNYTTGQTVAANISVSGISKGSGITGNAANDRYNANSWNTTSIDLTAYFEFTLTPAAGYEIDFSNFIYTGQASGTGPSSFAFRSSVDNYTANIGSPTASGTTISLSGAAYQNRTTAITFRFYGWGTTNAGGTFSINDFTFNGTVSSSASAPTVSSTTAVTSITTTSAATGGNVSANGGATLTERGVVYSSSATTPTTSHSKAVASGTATGTFTVDMTGLTPNTRYYYRAYATNSAGTSYASPTLSFWTASLAAVTTTAQSNVTTTSATAGGNVTALGTTGSTAATNTTSTVTAKGIVWALASSADPTVNTNAGITNDGTGTGSYTSTLSGLTLNTSYKYRSYATSPEGTSYGNIVTFTTLNVVAPTVTTTAFNATNDAGATSANIRGGITNNGGAAIIRKGFVWNTSNADLTVDNPASATVDDADDTDAAFTTSLSLLSINTQYFYVAFASNSTATGYGAVNNFFTKAATPGAPTVNNPTTTSLTLTNDANGNPTATEYVLRVNTPLGYRYVNSLGSIVDTETWITGTTLSNPITVNGLSSGTSYTFDVKARNGANVETPYGGTTTLSTATPSTPFFTLTESNLEFGPICIGTTSAPGYFKFLANNVPVGQQIAIYTLEGFTYSLTENGTYQDGLFTPNTGSEMTIWVKFTPVEVQTYPEEVNGTPQTIGVNSNGTSTLNVAVFGEGVNTPAIATTGVYSAVTTTTATLAGAFSEGCSAATGYGIQYSTTDDFAIGTTNDVAAATHMAGDYSVDLTGLTGCAMYYYRAYVTDGTGTYYGDAETFTTLSLAAPVAEVATDIAQTGFMANWQPVAGAAGYYLDVATDIALLSEDFANIVAPAGDETDYNIAATNTSTPEAKKINNLTNTTGWTGTNVYAEDGSIRVATGSGTHHITTPTVDLTSGDGVAMLYITAKHDVTSTANKSVTILHAADGSTFSTTLQTIELTEEFVTYSIPVTGGTANSKFRIQTAATSLNRFHIDDITVSNTQYVEGFESIDVAGTTYEVTALEPDTKYYYTVRAYGGTCTSDNSETVEVQTLKFLTLQASDNLAFGSVCTNASETGSFTFTGDGMSDATLNIAALEGFSYSLTEGGTYTPTLTISGFNGGGVTVYVEFSPDATQAYGGNITVTGQAPYAGAILEIPVTGSGIFTPAVATAEAAEDITMTSAGIDAASVEGNCTTTTGYGIVYSTADNFDPVVGTLAAGDNIVAGEYTVTLDGLEPCTTYYYRAYTTTTGEPVYSAQRNFTTLTIGSTVTELLATDIAGETFTANWEAVENASGYRLDVSTTPEFGVAVPGETTIETCEIGSGASSYATRTWTGVNNIGWQATEARGDQDINGNAVAFRGPGILSNTTPIAGGLDALSFKYARVFTGNPTLQVFINGIQYGDDIVVSSTTATTYTLSDLNISGNITIEIRNIGTSSNRVIIDDVAYTGQDIIDPSFIPGYENFNVSGGNTTSVEVSGLDNFTDYYYRIRAYTDGCTTGNSDVVQVTTRGLVTWKIDGGVAKWVPNVPIDETVDTAIETGYTLGSGNNFHPKSITVNTGGTFTVTSGNTFEVENEITNNAGPAGFIVENNANVIQVNENPDINSGSITVNRDSNLLFRNDYSMWSSPVDGQDIVSFSPHTASGRYYQYDSSLDAYVDASGTFGEGRGYLIRMPNSAVYLDENQVYQPTGTLNAGATVSQYNNSTGGMTFHGKFVGTPHNGTVGVGLSSVGGSFHLIGNPYPSPLDLTAFLADNDEVINGTVYIWRKKNASAATSAYVTMNRTGQYVDNGEPGTVTEPDGIIRTGQGFIVQMTENPAGSQVTFNNTMRSDDTSNQFFRNANAASQRPESHGVYLNLTNASGVYSQMYTGYIEGATDGRDNGIDSEYINDKPNVLATALGGKEFVIHGRALPFNSLNTEPLQLRTATGGQYTIAIDSTEGLFSAQAIYLQDNLLGVVHNLTASPYTFSTESGTFSSRFEIVYSPDGTLKTENPVANDSSIVIFKQDNVLKINSVNEDISDVTVFDIRGRKLYEVTDVNAASAQITTLQSEQQVLIVKVRTVNGVIVSKKVIY